MKGKIIDTSTIIGFFFAHILLFLTFQEKAVFWYLFTASITFLITFAIMKEEMDDELPFKQYITYGILTGILLFALFWVGNSLFHLLNIPISGAVTKLYKFFSPTMIWHYIVLLLIIIPGEEIFWRGFIQKRLLRLTKPSHSILISTVMYASVHVYSGSWLLLLAAIVAGLFWSTLYVWKRSIPLVVVSHLIFDLFLLVLIPLN